MACCPPPAGARRSVARRSVRSADSSSRLPARAAKDRSSWAMSAGSALAARWSRRSNTLGGGGATSQVSHFRRFWASASDSAVRPRSCRKPPYALYPESGQGVLLRCERVPVVGVAQQRPGEARVGGRPGGVEQEPLLVPEEVAAVHRELREVVVDPQPRRIRTPPFRVLRGRDDIDGRLVGRVVVVGEPGPR